MRYLLLLFGFWVSAASGVTVTFSGLQEAVPFGSRVYEESGVLVTTDRNADFGYYTQVGALHLDDSGTSITDRVDVSSTGRFDALSFDVLAIGTGGLFANLYNPLTNEDLLLSGLAYDNVLVQGYSSGALVAEDRFYMQDFPTYLFDQDFTNLDSLRISALRPDLALAEAAVALDYPDFFVLGVDCDDAPCAHFDIDNIVLSASPIPLPAALPLYLAGLFVLVYLRRMRT